jgi:hypothetical protein
MAMFLKITTSFLLDGLLDYSDVLQKLWSFEYTLGSNELTGNMTISSLSRFSRKLTVC